MATLFKTPSTGYRPPAGQYIGEFQRFEEGPASKFLDANGEAKPTVRWVWKIYDQNTGEPIVDPVTGETAEGDGITSDATGPKSKAYGWFEAHLGRKLRNGENMEQVEQEMVGKKVVLLYVSDSQGDGARLSVVLPYSG